MSAVIAETRTVYLAPTKGRRYLTKKSAIRAEAIAIIKKKYPDERPEYDVGLGGWNWSELPRSDVMLRRLMKIIRKA